ncbi:hypothetical protein EO98_09085 [Methanosarcina sp. 2.H.T.1A.6]|nr:hypothetical protein EO94_15475 [Methanosarcina sp. 2.H.T.1A.3]KKG15377.1 hypothetical protein EO97_17850 [Methanosarcina sp. 2.H.T.1A.15]KKG19611.1 hypothetical protein EO98_09085 [Methanosarcina sp. 2.H.T.1A.6]KKG26763.1 hypothetical protein EO96_02350 [Methanosarcina sp. 2.H.T.1A.8]
MGLFRKLRKILSVIFENESEQKGDDFEKYVVDLFDGKHCLSYSGPRRWQENTSDLWITPADVSVRLNKSLTHQHYQKSFKLVI